MKKQSEEMRTYRKEIQAKLLKYDSSKEIIRKDGVLTIIDSAISKFLDLVQDH